MNLRNFLFVLSGLILFSVSAFGQTYRWQLGIEGGPGISSLRGDAVPENMEPAKRYIGGVAAQYNITNRFSIKSGIAFEKKQMAREANIFDSVGMPVGTLQTHLNFYYYNFPLMARLTFGNKVQFFVNAGPYLGQLIQQVNITEADDNQPEIKVEFTESYKAIDLGITAGCGVGISLGNRSFLNLEIRDNLGLYNIDAFNGIPPSNDEIKTNSLYVIVGFFYKLGAIEAD